MVAWLAGRRRRNARSDRAAALQALPLGVVVVNARGVVLDLNQAAEDTIRTAAVNAVGRQLGDLLPGAHGDALPAEITVDDPGTSRRIALRRADLPGQDGAQVVLLQDMTATRVVEAELRTAEHELRTAQVRVAQLLAAAPMVLFECDAEGRCTRAEGQLLGMLHRDGTPDGRRLLRAGGAHDEISTLIRSALDGHADADTVRVGSLALEVACRPLEDRNGATVGVVGVALDATAREQAAAIRADLPHRLLTAQENERRRIADDLHDESVQVIAATLTDYTGLMDRLGALMEPADLTSVKDQLERVQDNLRRGLDAAQSLLQQLRPPVLDAEGAQAAIDQLLHQLRDPADWAGVHMSWELPDRLAPYLEQVAYRAAQEALTNVVRHARADKVLVRTYRHESAHDAVLEVLDDGVGFDLAEVQQRMPVHGHLGLRSMSEWLRSVGGSVAVATRPGQGTRVVFRLPLSTRPDDGARPRTTAADGARPSPAAPDQESTRSDAGPSRVASDAERSQAADERASGTPDEPVPSRDPAHAGTSQTGRTSTPATNRDSTDTPADETDTEEPAASPTEAADTSDEGEASGSGTEAQDTKRTNKLPEKAAHGGEPGRQADTSDPAHAPQPGPRRRPGPGPGLRVSP